jgi:lactoylglutathione lyase
MFHSSLHPASEPTMNGLRTAIYPVPDLDAAKTWYGELFGVKPYFDEPFYVGFDVAGYELGLLPASDKHNASADGAEALWGVDDIHAVWAQAIAAGATALVEPWNTGEDIVVGAFADPWGNRIGIIRNPHFSVPALGSTCVAEPPMSLGASEGDAIRSFDVSTTIDGATVAAAFAAFTTQSALARWFGNDARMELRIGGPFEILFLPEGNAARGSEGCRVLSWIPDRMLSFTWNAPPTMPHVRNLATWVVVEFEEVDQGVRVRITHMGWPEHGFSDGAHPEWAQAWTYFQAAWPAVLKGLAKYLAG